MYIIYAYIKRDNNVSLFKLKILNTLNEEHALKICFRNVNMGEKFNNKFCLFQNDCSIIVLNSNLYISYGIYVRKFSFGISLFACVFSKETKSMSIEELK